MGSYTSAPNERKSTASLPFVLYLLFTTGGRVHGTLACTKRCTYASPPKKSTSSSPSKSTLLIHASCAICIATVSMVSAIVPEIVSRISMSPVDSRRSWLGRTRLLLLLQLELSPH